MGLKWFQNGFIIQGLEFVCCESVETQHRGYAEDEITLLFWGFYVRCRSRFSKLIAHPME